MSQTNRRQMERLQRQLAINEHQFQIVSKQIDAAWSAHELSVRQNSRARMHIPQLENVYMTLSKQREILNTQRQRIAYIKAKTGYRPTASASASLASATPSRNGDATANTSVNSLSDSIFSMSLCDQVRLHNEQMPAERMAALRNVLRSRPTIAVIVPCRPERKGLSSEVVLERKIAQGESNTSRMD